MPVHTGKKTKLFLEKRKLKKNLVSLAWAHNCHHKTEIEFKVHL